MKVIEEVKTADSSRTHVSPFRCESYWIKACNVKDSSLCLECRENLYLEQARTR